MHRPLHPAAAFLLALILSLSTGCRVRWLNFGPKPGPRSHIDADEKAAAAKLRPSPDEVADEAEVFKLHVHELLGHRRFDELEKIAEDLRREKTLYRNGTWKLRDFYVGMPPRNDVPESGWQKAAGLHQEWLAARPQSLTAHLAYISFLVDYAWQARGSGYADTVTNQGWRLMGERLEEAEKTLRKARTLPGKDPNWWLLALRVGLGSHWPAQVFDDIVKEGLSVEPTFWHLHISRAYSLLPRWYGEPGDWEAYAAKAAALPDGLGDEAYARIAIHLLDFHGNLFQESKASWPKTRAGLEQLRKKYPDAAEFIGYTAYLAGMAQDRSTAQAMFTQLGNTYLPRVWRSPQMFVHVKNCAETGRW
jgi:hypothetical protein